MGRKVEKTQPWAHGLGGLSRRGARSNFNSRQRKVSQASQEELGERRLCLRKLGAGQRLWEGRVFRQTFRQDLEALRKLKGRNSLSKGTGLGKLQKV